MLVPELRWPLLALILILITVVLHAVLEHTPFGWMVLESAKRYVYANEYARRLLELEIPSGPVPAVEWDFLLDDDHPTLRLGLRVLRDRDPDME